MDDKLFEVVKGKLLEEVVTVSGRGVDSGTGILGGELMEKLGRPCETEELCGT